MRPCLAKVQIRVRILRRRSLPHSSSLSLSHLLSISSMMIVVEGGASSYGFNWNERFKLGNSPSTVCSLGAPHSPSLRRTVLRSCASIKVVATGANCLGFLDVPPRQSWPAIPPASPTETFSLVWREQASPTGRCPGERSLASM